MNALTRSALLVVFVAAIVTLVFFRSHAIAASLWSGGAARGDGMVDTSSWLIPNVLVLGVATMLGWALFGKRR